MGILNQEFGFDEVRWAVSRRTSYDVGSGFTGTPRKSRLEAGAKLYRLDLLADGKHFLQVWWTPEEVYRKLLRQGEKTSEAFRQRAEAALALPKPRTRPLQGTPETLDRLTVTEIELTQPVYAWTGMTRPLFGQPGGVGQVYLPNLCLSENPRFSAHARLVRTYLLGTAR